MAVIPNHVMGDVWPAVQPGARPGEYGSARLEAPERCEVRSLQTFRLVFTAGRYGLDDTGAIRISHRFTYDGPALQTEDPTAVNYVTAEASNGAGLTLYWEPYALRPWDKGLRATVTRGLLRPGDKITITYGDRSGGSPGFLMQTFCESGFEFRVSVDACATGQFVPIDEGLTLAVTPGPPERWVAVLPTLRRPGETFRLDLKAEDAWGNPSDQASGRLRLEPSVAVDGLPATVDFPLGERALSLDGLSVAEAGVLRIRVLDETGAELALSNPLVVRDGGASYWGDLHGQSGETVGVNPIHEYFRFARDLAFLDVASHQGNDFQIKTAFWEVINQATAAMSEDGRFVLLPGYEWSGNTGVGGDHNVFFRHEGRPIRRSSHAMLSDRSDLGLDAPNAAALFEALQDEDCVLYAHVGGRPADVSYAHDARLRTAVEVHSDWGTFEWIMLDSLALGHRVGLVCNSDGHKGRPGASYPGAASFGAYGGLTCFLTDRLDRDAIFECLRRRHHYGTTGSRLHLDVRARFEFEARLFERDPRVAPSDGLAAREAIMGDIIQTDEERAMLAVEVIAQAPIERVEIRNGAETLKTLRCYGAADLGPRLRLVWVGAEYRGRGRQTQWLGELRLDGAEITRFERFNAWNHERPVRLADPARLTFDAITTGNFGGVDLWLDETPGARVTVESNHTGGAFDLSEIGVEGVAMEAGGLGRRLRLQRLPETLTGMELSVEIPIDLAARGDNPLWVKAVTIDGACAWSSPIYVCRGEG